MLPDAGDAPRTGQAILVLLAFIVSGCGDSEFEDIAAADRATLYSIDGTESGADYAANPTPAGFLHGYAVLGMMELDRADQDRVSKVLNDGLQDSVAASCFLPRHAVRIEHGNLQKDYVICFECFQYVVYENGKESRHGLVTDAPKSVLDKLLREAGIPLAPEAFSKEWHAVVEKEPGTEDSAE